MKKKIKFWIVAIISPIIIEQLYLVTAIAGYTWGATHLNRQDSDIFLFIYFGLIQPIGAVALAKYFVSFFNSEVKKLWWILSACYVPSAVTLCFYLDNAIRKGKWVTFSEKSIYLFLWLLLWSSVGAFLGYIALRIKNKKIAPQPEQTA